MSFAEVQRTFADIFRLHLTSSQLRNTASLCWQHSSQGQRAQPSALPLPLLVFAAANHEYQECMQALVADGSSHPCPTSLPGPFISTGVGNFLLILLIVKNKTSKAETITGCQVSGQELCQTHTIPQPCWTDEKSEFQCFIQKQVFVLVFVGMTWSLLVTMTM